LAARSQQLAWLLGLSRRWAVYVMVVGLARRRRPPIQACPCQKPPRWLGVQQHPRSHQRSVARLPRPRRSDGTHGPRRRRRRRGRGCRVGGGGGPPVSRHLRAGGRPGGAGLGIEQQQLVVQRVVVQVIRRRWRWSRALGDLK